MCIFECFDQSVYIVQGVVLEGDKFEFIHKVSFNFHKETMTLAISLWKFTNPDKYSESWKKIYKEKN